jgi:hypothetical protein
MEDQVPEHRQRLVTLRLDADGARDLLTAARAGERRAYVDHERLRRAAKEAQRQIDEQYPSE